jgi:hypothetical protein
MTKSDKSFHVTHKTVEGDPWQPPDREISPVAEPTPMEISSSKARSLKGKKLIFSPPVVAETTKPRRPFTRSTNKQHVPMEDGAVEASSQQKYEAQLSKHPI